MHWGMLAKKDHKDIDLKSLRLLLVADGANPCKLFQMCPKVSYSRNQKSIIDSQSTVKLCSGLHKHSQSPGKVLEDMTP